VSGCVEGISPAHPELADYLGRMTNEQIWNLLNQGQAPDPLTGAEAVVLNDIKAKFDITLATEGIQPDICRAMGFGHVRPDDLSVYLDRRLRDKPDLTIGILRQSAEVLPIVDPDA
jgi:hypothetical protein